MTSTGTRQLRYAGCSTRTVSSPAAAMLAAADRDRDRGARRGAARARHRQARRRLDRAPATAADADVVQARILAAAERAAEQGLRLGFHNHDGELAVLDDGSALLERLLDADGAKLFLELDLGWVWYAGVDPLALLERAGARAPLVHVKDLRNDGGPVHVPLGAGEVDYGRTSGRGRQRGSRVADPGAGRDTRARLRGSRGVDGRARQALRGCRGVVAVPPAELVNGSVLAPALPPGSPALVVLLPPSVTDPQRSTDRSA